MSNTILDDAMNCFLSGNSIDECAKIIADYIGSKYKDSDGFATQFNIGVSIFLYRIQPLKQFNLSVESDRLLLLFCDRRAALRQIVKQQRDAEEFAAALDAAGIPRDQAWTVLADATHVLKDMFSC